MRAIARADRLFVGLALILAVSGCASSGASNSGSPVGATAAATPALASPGALLPAGSRPPSPARIAITSPAQGAVLTGSTIHVTISLQGAQVVPVTTSNVRPDEGHVHLYVDNTLVSMSYGLETDLPVHPGTYVLRAEFVAADHAPFDPRVWSEEVVFTVR